MNKSVKSYIYKGNIFNFIVLTFTSLFQTAALIIVSLMLEKIMAIASEKDLNALYEQLIMFLVLLVTSIIMYIFIIYLKPKYQKKAITQYKNNIYSQILDKNISNFNKYNTSTYISALTNDVHKIEEDYLFSAFDLITNFTASLTCISNVGPGLSVVGPAGNFAGLAIGLSLILIHLVGIHYTGTSVNPARSIAPAIFEGGKALSELWVFIVGPFIGATLSALVWALSCRVCSTCLWNGV